MSFLVLETTFIVVYQGAVCTAESVEKYPKACSYQAATWHLFTTPAKAKLFLLLLFPENQTTLRMSKMFTLIKCLIHVCTHFKVDIKLKSPIT